MGVFDLTAAELNARLDQLSVLAGRPRTVVELSGGLTNRNLKVTTPDGAWVARFTDAAGGLLGIDRDQEHENSRRAEQSGVGAHVAEYRADLGILLVGFIDGPSLTNADFSRRGVLERVVDAVRTLHAGPEFVGRFDMVERQRAYLRTALDHGYRIPHGYLDHADTFAEIARALAVHDPGTVPCNNDLLAANFIDEGDRVRIIDYEYAGNNDAYFELGNLAGECGLGDDGLAEVVTAYTGAGSRSAIARARLQRAVAQYGWTLWGAIRAESSGLDFDFWAWATERYDEAVATMAGPDLRGLLADVTNAADGLPTPRPAPMCRRTHAAPR